MFKSSCWQVFYWRTCSRNFLKDIRNASKMQPLNFKKKVIRGANWVFTKKKQKFSQDFPRTLWQNVDFIPMKSNKNQSISCNNSGVITSQIELTNLTKARKSKKHSSFIVKYWNCIFSFLFFLGFFQFFHHLLLLPCCLL